MEKKRGTNWSDQEKAILREECVKNSQILHGAVCSSLTMQEKTEVWHKIVDKVNAVEGCNRSISESKKKWLNM